MEWPAGRSDPNTHTNTHTFSPHTCTHSSSNRVDAALLRTSACYRLMTIWWDLMPVYCELYQNWQGHPCILMPCLFPTTLQLCFSLIAAHCFGSVFIFFSPHFLYWTSKDRMIMLIHSTKTSCKTDSEDTGVKEVWPSLTECTFTRCANMWYT